MTFVIATVNYVQARCGASSRPTSKEFSKNPVVVRVLSVVYISDTQ